MINEDYYLSSLKKFKESTTYINPFLLPRPNDSINLLPLFCKQAIVNIDKKSDILRSTNFEDYVEEGYYSIAGISEEDLPSFANPESSLLRKELFNDSDFRRNYSKAIQQDKRDEILLKMFNKSNLSKNITFNSTSFFMNWDLLFIKLYQLRLYSDSEYAELCKTKLFEDFSISHNEPLPEKYRTIIQFLKKISVNLPSKIDVDDMKSFRKERIIRTFQNWLNSSFQNKLENEEDEIESLIQEFNELVESQNQKIKGFPSVVSSLSGLGVGALLSAPEVGGFVGGTVGFLLENQSHKLQKHLNYCFNKNPWTFVLNDIK